MKKTFLIFSLVVLLAGFAWAQGSETFANSTATASYLDGSFVGDTGVTWTYGHSRNEGDYPITTNGLMLRRASDSYLTATISGGVGNFSFEYRKAFTGSSPRQLEFLVNDVQLATTPEFGIITGEETNVYTMLIENVNTTGDVVIKIKNVGTTTTNRQTTLDNISWTGYTGGGTPVAATPVIAPGTGNYYAPFTAAITCTTPNPTIYYTLDGTDPTDASTEYLGPINIAATTTLKAIAYAPGYDPSNIATATYTFPPVIDVANIAALRAGLTDGTVYHLTNEVIITYRRVGYPYCTYIQDATAAIMIYDNGGIISTDYDLYDGVTGIYGTLTLYNGLLELIPVTNAAPATSVDNDVVPEVRTLDSLTPADQAKLIKVMDVTLDTTLGSFGSGAQNISATDPTATRTLRTFPSTDYSGTPIPTVPQNITCLVGQFNTGMQISPRFLSDFEDAGEPGLPVVLASFTALVTAQNSVQLTWVTQSESQMLGYRVYRSTTSEQGDLAQINQYTHTDSEVEIGNTYYYWLEAVDFNSSAYHGPVSVTVQGNVPPVLPEVTTLRDAYPNPFRAGSQTSIGAALKAGETGTVNIYNLQGQLVRSFAVQEGLQTLNWDGRDSRKQPCASGVYFYRLSTPSLNQTRKLVLMK